MAERIHSVLFICTGNSARSILAEALLNHLARGRFVGYSAGAQPKGEVHPLTLSTLASMRIPVGDVRSNGTAEFLRSDAPELDFVFTLSDDAAGELGPDWPGKPITAHWGVPDPAAVTGGPEQRAQAFIDVAVTLKRRIELMLALPIDRLDAMAIQREMRTIGER
jgi:arsenate reductase